jgi:peptidoglycan LD-endopeptidase LytH
MWVAREQVLRIVPTPLVPIAPHDQYAAALVVSGLAQRDTGRAWAAAAEQALGHPVETSAWFSTDAAFDGAPSTVLAWTFDVRRGQKIVVDVETPATTLFLDLFDGDALARVAYARAGTSRLEHVADRDGPLIARLQPALGAGSTGPGLQAAAARYRVAQHVEASLLFPVEGRGRAAVQSGFGAGRDEGRRRHEGIDIFAPRGTPVVAAADGWITSRTTNRLGGNVVWIWAPSRRLSLYYAHLETQAVAPGERVRAGEVVGYVGNTGNARGTAPHLHFGVYAPLAGAVDPFPFVVVDRPGHQRRSPPNPTPGS